MSWAAIAGLMGRPHAMIERHYVRLAGARDWFGKAAAEHRLRAALTDAAVHIRSVELEAIAS